MSMKDPFGGCDTCTGSLFLSLLMRWFSSLNKQTNNKKTNEKYSSYSKDYKRLCLRGHVSNVSAMWYAAARTNNNNNEIKCREGEKEEREV